MRLLLLLFLLFTGVPLIELALLIEVGQRVGTAPTIGLVVLTGVVGAALARRQGFAIVGRIRAELAVGRVPAAHLLDGLLVLVAAVLLVTPGLLTDGIGFLLLLPPTRTAVRLALLRMGRRWLREGRITFHAHEPPDDRGPPRL